MYRRFSWRFSSTVSSLFLRGAVLFCALLAVGVCYARYSGYELLSVASNSMSPVMHRGDAVLISKHTTDLRLGNVASFASPMSPKVVITHRVIGVDVHRGMIETRGDNTSLVDAPIPMWNIIGKVTDVLPKIGFVLDLLKNPLGLLIVIYLPALGVIVSEIKRLASYYATGIPPAEHVHYRLRPIHGFHSSRLS